MKLKISGSGFTDLDNTNINWHSNENSEVKQWLLEGNIPEPEFTEAELAQQVIYNKISEAKAYLASTDFKMTVDYYATLTVEQQEELTIMRATARGFLKGQGL